MENIKKVFQTLADSNRLKIIYSISHNEMSVGELVKITSLSQPLVSFHLRVLKQNGLMTTTRKGPFIFYSIKDKRLLHAIDLFVELYNKPGAEAKGAMSFEHQSKNHKN